jgi:hypothetical protein
LDVVTIRNRFLSVRLFFLKVKAQTLLVMEAQTLSQKSTNTWGA